MLLTVIAYYKLISIEGGDTMTQGKGWHGDALGHKQAGKKGGESTALTHGKEFYSSIGKKGGSVSGGNFAHNPQRARDAGRKGGKAKGKK